MKFKETEINLGYVLPNTKHTFKFRSDTPIDYKKLKSIVPSCGGCTKVTRKGYNFIEVQYSAPSFPEHLVGDFITQKNVYITRLDGTKITLTFTAKMKKPQLNK